MIINVDGSCRSNPGPGGVGIYFRDFPEQNEIVPFTDGLTTNIRMELMAIAHGIGRGIYLIENRNLERQITILTDSEFSVKVIYEWLPGWIKNGFKKSNGQPVQNQDIIKNCLAPMLTETMNRRINLVVNYIPREENSEADQLAKMASGQAAETLRPFIEELQRQKRVVQVESAAAAMASLDRTRAIVQQTQFQSLVTPVQYGLSDLLTVKQPLKATSIQEKESGGIVIRFSC